MISSDPAVVVEFQARVQALKLRRAGPSYSAIAIVIAEYHGVTRKADSWSYICRKQGAPAMALRGRPFRGAVA